MNYLYNNQIDALFIYSEFIELRHLYMFRALTAHHQEVRCVYVANDTSKMTVSEPDPLTVILEVSFAIYIHLTS
jgi:hypothetical protein